MQIESQSRNDRAETLKSKNTDMLLWGFLTMVVLYSASNTSAEVQQQLNLPIFH